MNELPEEGTLPESVETLEEENDLPLDDLEDGENIPS